MHRVSNPGENSSTAEGRLEDPWAVTLVGCVAQGKAAGGYTLTTSIPQPEATDRDAVKSIKLVLTSTEVDLTQHVGHTVSVTGVHAAQWTTGTTGTTSSEKPASEGAVKDDDKKTTGTFAVTSLKMNASLARNEPNSKVPPRWRLVTARDLSRRSCSEGGFESSLGSHACKPH